MNIHEYQAKALLPDYGAPVSDGRVVQKADEAKTKAGELDGPLWVVKAQIHAGGRRKPGRRSREAVPSPGIRGCSWGLTRLLVIASLMTQPAGGRNENLHSRPDFAGKSEICYHTLKICYHID